MRKRSAALLLAAIASITAGLLLSCAPPVPAAPLTQPRPCPTRGVR